MKKLIGSVIAAFMAVTAGAAPASTLTNVVTRINVQLTFISSVTNITSITTNIVTHITKSATNTVTTYLTNTVYKSVSTPIATKDVINALLPGAPKNAYLAEVRTGTNGALTEYFAIRQGNTTLELINPSNTGTGITVFDLLTNDVTFGSERDTSVKTSFAANSKTYSLVNFMMNSATLTFNVTGVSSKKWTGDSINANGTSYQVSDVSINVAGSGKDAVGASEIVTGTITLNGAQLSD